MRINTNVSSLNAWRNLTSTDGAMGKNLERLSSGFRINRAGDDVAGLAISENMRAQIKGLNQAVKNAQDGISLLQTAEGSLTEVHNMLHRMRELAVQSANGTLQPEDRKQIQTEMDNLTKEVTRITNATQFNGMDLIDGSLQNSAIRDVSLQIGPNGGQTVQFGIGAMDSSSLGIGRDVLTGSIDNGERFAATTAPAGATITAVTGAGQGISADKEYRINYTNGSGYQLQSNDGAGWSNVGAVVAHAAGPLTIGDATTKETLTITVPGAAPLAGANGATTFDNDQNVATKVGAVGAGMDAGNNYRVLYDSSTKRVQLQSTSNGGTSWDNIGTDKDVTGMAGKTISVGDENTARTVEITLVGTLPTLGTSTDSLKIQSSSSHVKLDANNLIAGGGVSKTNVGLASGDYKVVVLASGTDIQLQDMSGNAIGAALTIASVASQTNVTIGDAATKRTITLDFTAMAAAASGQEAIIHVNNNEQHNAAASFSGGAKKLSAQAFAGLNVSSVDGAQKAIASIDTAIGKVSYQRSQLGAITNRLEHTINNLNVVSENLTASESRIRDVDMALEMTQFTKHQILMQSGTAMLAQANQKNQAVLSLLR